MLRRVLEKRCALKVAVTPCLNTGCRSRPTLYSPRCASTFVSKSTPSQVAIQSKATPQPTIHLNMRRFNTDALNPGRLTCETAKASLLNDVDIFIFDCDGVIWRGDSVIDRVPLVLNYLRGLGKKCFFVTNNSTKSRKGYKKKFDALKLPVAADEIFSSSFAAAAYLELNRFKETGKKVYIVGDVGIQEELDLINIPYLGGPEDANKQIELKPGFALPHDPDVGCVIVGFDKNINYYKIQYAQLCINQNPGCLFVATNLDAVTHLTDAQEWSGNGSMVGAIKGCTNREPIVVGKPSALMIEYLETLFGIENRSRICMVGDRLDTDVLFGVNNGLKTCLTLSGVTKEETLMSDQNKIKPDFYVDSIADFLPERAG